MEQHRWSSVDISNLRFLVLGLLAFFGVASDETLSVLAFIEKQEASRAQVLFLKHKELVNLHSKRDLWTIPSHTSATRHVPLLEAENCNLQMRFISRKGICKSEPLLSFQLARRTKETSANGFM